MVLVLAGLALIAQSAWSQNAEKPKTHGILGYLDANTGAFKPVPKAATDEELAASTAANISPTTGKFVFNITINIVSTLPATDVIICGASASVSEPLPFTTIDEQAEVLATRSGSKATCTVTIPYSWPLTTPGQDIVGMSFSVNASAQTLVLARQSLHELPGGKVPANNSTTTMSFNATI
jgi:hypothetical protein